MKIFIDVDNTVLEHTSSYNIKTESRVHKTMGQNPIYNEYAIENMYKTAVVTDPSNFRELFARDNTYILTKSSNDTYERYKQIKIAQVLGTTVEELLAMTDSSGKPKYMFVNFFEDKSSFIKNMFDIQTLKNCILIDDYSENLANWERDGGIGIKFYNEYNSPIHPMGGLVISNFKIFTANLTPDPNTFIFVDNLVANELLSSHMSKINVISLIDLIYDEIIKTFNLEFNQFDAYKSKHSKFMREYYIFLESFNFYKISEFIREKAVNDKVNVLDIPFPYDKSIYKSELNIKNNLVIEYNAVKEQKERVADIYITMPTELILGYKYDMLRSTLMDIITIINSNQIQ